MASELRHGSHCSCKVLEVATKARPGSISCLFCKTILQKRWRMTCNHGKDSTEEKPMGPERWAVIGALRGDAVKAILVAEESGMIRGASQPGRAGPQRVMINSGR